MMHEEARIWYSLDQLEAANAKILNEIRTIARLSNLTLGMNAAASPLSQDNINLCYQTSKTLDRLRKEAQHQAQILDGLRCEFESDFYEWNYGSEGPQRRLGRG